LTALLLRYGGSHEDSAREASAIRDMHSLRMQATDFSFRIQALEKLQVA
jgi:hypothetical protein